MANHEIKYPREFVQEVRKFEDEDKAVSGLWNDPTGALLNNDVYLKEQLEELSENVEKNKTHTHKIKEVDNLRFDLYTKTELSVGKYTRVIESELINKVNTGVYAKYNVELDYTNYFDLEIYINQEKLLTEGMPQVELYVSNMPSYVNAYATIQSDPDWQIWDVDVHLKIDKAFKKLKLRQLNLNGNSDVLHVSSAYKVQDTLSTTKYAKIIEATKTTAITADDKEKLDGIEEKAEENQNAFSNVKVGAITILANGKEAQFELAAGTNIKITGDNATKKIVISSPDKQPASFIQQDAKNRFMTDEEKGKLEEIEAGANKYVHPNDSDTRHVTDTEKNNWNKIGDVTSLNTTDKSSLVAAVNEIFQSASNGKKAVANAAGTDSNATFQAIANELNEQKKVLALSHSTSATNASIRGQAGTIKEYVHGHLPDIIVQHGGNLVANGGAAVTKETSSLDTLYYSIINLAETKNHQINAVTNEKNQWYQNYVNMEADRNNWMNIANSKKSYSAGTIPNTYGSTAIKVRTGFRPRIVHLGCTKSGGTPCNIAYVADYNIQYKAGYGGDGASGGDGTIVMESDGFTFRIPISSSIQLYSIYYLAWS